MNLSRTSFPSRAPRPSGRLETAPAPLAEVLSLPARFVTELPLATRFVLEGLGISKRIVLDPGGIATAGESGEIVFSGDEVAALVLGVQAERLWPADLKGYCLLKLHDAGFKVTDELTLGGVEPLADPGWSLTRVLRALDLELRSVEIADDTVEAHQKAA